MRFHTAALAGVLLTSGCVVHAAEQNITIAGLQVTVWGSGTDGAVRKPVIIFSHGFHGCATQSRFLMEAFASAGYLVFAPNHKDATCAGGAATWSGKPEEPFGQPETWNPSSYRDRADDVRHLIEALRGDERFRARGDWSRIGLAGHSLGGYTVLELAGAWPESTPLAGLKAVLALSPYSQPFVAHHTLAGVSVPVMYQGGTRDLGITPALAKPMGAYDQTPAPKYFVEFDRAGHMAWTNFVSATHDAITMYSVAFMNHYVKGEPADPRMTKQLSDVTVLRYASDLGHADLGAASGRSARGRGLGRAR